MPVISMQWYIYILLLKLVSYVCNAVEAVNNIKLHLDINDMHVVKLTQVTAWVILCLS